MPGFVWYDVFTDRRYAGNPLGVFPDATGIPETEMPRIARELNLSETTFVLAPETPGTTHRVRIFTPSRELAFAGHPTVGTAVALAEVAGATSADLVLGLGAGPTKVAVRPGAGGVLTASFAAPQLPRLSPALVGAHEVARLAGIGVEDLVGGGDGDGIPIHVADAGGTNFVVAQVRSLDVLARSRPAGTAPDVVGLYLVAGAGARWQVRMFAPGSGVVEDPATGSAACAFAGTLAAHVEGMGAEGTHDVEIRQGVEMGRPSDISLSYDVAGGAVTQVRLAGSAVQVLSGTLPLAF